MTDEARPLTWQDEVLAARPSGIDTAQLERFLALSPTERLEEMRLLLTGLRLAAGSGDDGHWGTRLPHAG